jgi:phosphohistidine swiveling domain-containing protein
MDWDLMKAEKEMSNKHDRMVFLRNLFPNNVPYFVRLNLTPSPNNLELKALIDSLPENKDGYITRFVEEDILSEFKQQSFFSETKEAVFTSLTERFLSEHVNLIVQTNIKKQYNGLSTFLEKDEIYIEFVKEYRSLISKGIVTPIAVRLKENDADFDSIPWKRGLTTSLIGSMRKLRESKGNVVLDFVIDENDSIYFVDYNTISKHLQHEQISFKGEVKKWEEGLTESACKQKVIVAKYASPSIGDCITNSKGVITEYGGKLCHLSVLCIENEIPFLPSVSNVFDLLEEGCFVVVENGVLVEVSDSDAS